jgi:hypothetical protein
MNEVAYLSGLFSWTKRVLLGGVWVVCRSVSSVSSGGSHSDVSEHPGVLRYDVCVVCWIIADVYKPLCFFETSGAARPTTRWHILSVYWPIYTRWHILSVYWPIYTRWHILSVYWPIYTRWHILSVYWPIYTRWHILSVYCDALLNASFIFLCFCGTTDFVLKIAKAFRWLNW